MKIVRTSLTIVRQILALCIAIAVLSLGLNHVASAVEPAVAATAKKYTSCKKMNKTYPAGVAKSVSASKKAVKQGFKAPEVSGSVYKSNKKLDKDKDGVACEKKRSSSAATKEGVCLAGSVGYTYTPGAERLPFAVQITNANSSYDANDVRVEINVTSGTRIIRQETIRGNRLPSGQSAWAAEEIALHLYDGHEALTSINVDWKVTCDTATKAGGSVLGGQASLEPFGDYNRVSAEILNTSGRDWGEYPRPQPAFVLFDAAGNPLGGTRTYILEDVPQGFSVQETTYVFTPLPQAISAVYSVMPS